MAKNDKLKNELDKLALSIAETSASASFPDKLDAFKVLTSYYLGLTKAGKKSGEDDKPKGETFDAYRKSIETSGG